VKLFGEEFAAAVERLEPGRWSAPIRSPFGLHLVMVEERRGASTASLEEVRERALRGYRAERHQQYLEKMMTELRSAYEVRVEPDAIAQR
jgi:peptidyl-prolyl cis-trans isomerase C